MPKRVNQENHAHDFIYNIPKRVVDHSWWMDAPQKGFTQRAQQTVKSAPGRTAGEKYSLYTRID